MSVWDDPAERLAEYLKQVSAGRHDSLCEQQERSWLCNCGKRARIARGVTELPTEDLYFPPPGCAGCDGDLEYDGDQWACYACNLSWASDGRASSASFTDDFGDLDFADPRRQQFGRPMVDLIGRAR